MDKLHDLDAEKAVLGALLINSGILVEALGLVQPADFYDEGHRSILEAMQGLYTEGLAVDYLTVSQRADGHLKALGGPAYLHDLIEATPTSMNWQTYAQIVYRLSALRKLMACSGQIAKLAYDTGSEHIDEVFAKAHRMVEAITPQTSDEALLMWLDSLDAFFNCQLERSAELDAIEAGEAKARVTFPWSAVQRYVTYLRPGMLAVIAADTSVGKTTAMECCAEHWAREGLQVLFFHLELSHRFMIDRRMARQSGRSLSEIENGTVEGHMVDADNRMRQWRGAIHYVHCPGWSAARIMQLTRTMHAKGRCDVVVIDYFQKLRLGYRQGENKADALGNAAEGIKNGLEQMGIPGMVGSQVNRQTQHAARVTAGHIRGSGEIGEKANVVLTLDRDILSGDVYEGDRLIATAGQRSPEIHARIDKNTSGATGDCELVMNGARFLILDRSEATQ